MEKRSRSEHQSKKNMRPLEMNPKMKPSLSLRLRRWLDIVGLTAVGAVFGILMYPVLQRTGEAVAGWFPGESWILRGLLVGVSSCLATLVLFRFGSLPALRWAVRWAVWKLAGKIRENTGFQIPFWGYPPAWLAGVGASIAVALLSPWMWGLLNQGAWILDSATWGRLFLWLLGGMAAGCLVDTLSIRPPEEKEKKRSNREVTFSPGIARSGKEGRGEGGEEKGRTLGEDEDDAEGERPKSRLEDSGFASPEDLLEWVRSDDAPENPEDDRFGMEPMGWRLARLLQAKEKKSIGIVGPFGSGKSTVVKFARHYVENRSAFLNRVPEEKRREMEDDLLPEGSLVFCKVGGWGLREGSAIDHILRMAVGELSLHADCAGILSLPLRYRAALSLADSKWSRFLLDVLFRSASPDEALGRMDDILASIGKRMILIVEDLDRNDSEEPGFWTEIVALLDRLEKERNITFLVALNRHPNTIPILDRICRHVETVPEIEPFQAHEIIRLFRECLLSMITDGAESPIRYPMGHKQMNSDFGMLEHRLAADWERHFINTGDEDSSAIRSLSRLIALSGIGPRTLKSALRRTDTAWETLRGEIRLDDVLVLNILRAVAPEVFAFIHPNIHFLRGLGNADENSKSTFQQRWSELSAGGRDRRVPKTIMTQAGTLLSFLFPAWAPRNDSPFFGVEAEEFHLRPQGVVHDHPVDYWRRFQAEALDPNDISDQVVLMAIENYIDSRKCPFPTALPGNSLPEAILNSWNENPAWMKVRGKGKRYQLAARIRHLGRILGQERIRQLIGEVLSALARKDGTPEPEFGDGNFGALFDLLHETGGTGEGEEEWFLEEVRKALPLSFHCALVFVHSWRRQNRKHGRPDMDEGFLRVAGEMYGVEPVSFIRGLSGKHESILHDLLEIVWPDAERNRQGRNCCPKSFPWIRDLVARAAREHPHPVLDRFLLWLVTFRDGAVALDRPYDLRKTEAVTIFGDELGALLRGLIDNGVVFDHSQSLSGGLHKLVDRTILAKNSQSDLEAWLQEIEEGKASPPPEENSSREHLSGEG